ncbi:YwiC-like family protein [Evansella sp. AB-rgal1]|uniref:YwiC-like family protein n=1 Tax=Evansella sp. AB-rgal1 TaxID=3242696 RepID=UPI00359DB9B1
MKWYIPKEHGAWAMLIVPYWIGATISGVQWIHVIFFLGIFSIYFAQAPLLTYIRNPKHKDVWASFAIYAVIGLSIMLPIMIMEPALLVIGICILPLFCINLLFAKLKKERLFINDLVAIIALSSLLLLAYRLTEPSLSLESFTYVLITILFYTGSVFHVKSLIREKNNSLFQRWSIVYHIAIIPLSFALQWYGAAITFSISLGKTIFVPTKCLQRPIHIGVVEVINSVVFFIIIVSVYFTW